MRRSRDTRVTFCTYRSDNSVEGRVARWNLILGFPAMGGEFGAALSCLVRCFALLGEDSVADLAELREDAGGSLRVGLEAEALGIRGRPGHSCLAHDEVAG
jgi:hypothetical protein